MTPPQSGRGLKSERARKSGRGDVRRCAGAAAYVHQAIALSQAVPPVRSVPILSAGRSAAQLRQIFPECTFSAISPPPIAACTAQDPDQDLVADWASNLIAAQTGAGDPTRVLIAIAGRTDTLAAIYYGLQTRRSIRLMADFDAVEAALAGVTSAILAGPPEVFGKRLLKRLLDWAQQSPAAPRQIGIITGRDPVQMFDLVAKLVLAGLPRGTPEQALIAPAGQGDAFEFIGAHGNELHLSYRDGVLCGRSAALAATPAAGFDCGAGCQFKPRYRADQVRKSTVFLVSCDGFTPSDGFAPSAFSLLFGLLDGPVCNILAPYKHVQANAALLTMIKALARANYPLGEIAFLANGRANRGVLPDYGYVVLGDPELTAIARPPEPAPPPETVETAQGALVRAVIRPDQTALTVRLAVPHTDQPLALVPVSDNLRAGAPLFTIGALPGRTEIDVSLFDAAPLPAGLVEFAIVAAQPADPAILARTVAQLQNCRLFAAILEAEDTSADLQAQLWHLLHSAAAFPRLIEAAHGQALMLQLDALIATRLAQVQRALADSLLAALATQRLWISQDYVKLFACVTRAAADSDSSCPHCTQHVTTWRYDDPLTNLPSRHMGICDRCGIIADAPVVNAIQLAVETIGSLRRRDVPVTARITNTGTVPAGASLVVQMNRWQIDGIGATDCRAEFMLGPGETREHCATLHLPSPFQDDVLAIQAFAVTDQLDLVFASQKVMVAVRPQ